MGGQGLTNLSSPSGSSDAATKGYTDGYLGGQVISALSSITNGQVLAWNSTTSKWEPATVAGGGASTSIITKSIDTVAPTTTGQPLTYNATSGKWEAGSLLGTANQITVTPAVGSLTLSTPQNIGTGSSPTFAGMTLSGLNSVGVVRTNASGVFSTSAIAAADMPALTGDITTSAGAVATSIGTGKVTSTHILDGTIAAGDLANNTLTSTQVSATGGIATYAATSSSATSVTLTSTQTTYLADASGGAITLTLPAPSAAIAGKTFTIKKTDSSTATITISPNAAETIDGASSEILRTQYQTIQLTTNGTDWFVLERSGLKSLKLIHRSTVTGAATNTITISGLNGDADIRYVVKIHHVGAVGTAAVFLRPNGDDTVTHYSRVHVYGSSGGPAGGEASNDVAGSFLGGPANWTLQDCVIEFFAKANAGRRTLATSCSRDTDGSLYNIHWFNFWNDTTNTNLTSMTFSANTNLTDTGTTNGVNAFGVGTTVDVYAVR